MVSMGGSDVVEEDNVAAIRAQANMMITDGSEAANENAGASIV